MRKFRKLTAAITATLMVAAMSIPMATQLSVLAAEGDPSIFIENSNAGHTYEAYQIFAGKLEGTILSDIIWGEGVNTTKTVEGVGLVAAIQAITIANPVDGTEQSTITPFASKTTAKDIAEVLSEYNTNEELAKEFAAVMGNYLGTAQDTISTTTTIGTGGDAKTGYLLDGLSDSDTTPLKAGYYLVKDQDNTLTGVNTYTSYILQVLGAISMAPKNGTATSEKTVSDINDSTETAATPNLTSADHDIGDVIDFQLKATVGSDYANYTKYKLTFHDEMETGLTFTPDSNLENEIENENIVVKVKTGTAEAVVIPASNYTVKASELGDGCSFEIIFDNLKTLKDANNNAIAVAANSVITVDYKATLNDKANIGSAGNKNTSWITFSNNPYSEIEMGKTPDDTVIVFTYQVVINKVDGDKNPLDGADFELYKQAKNGDWVKVDDSLKTITGTPDDTETTEVNESSTASVFTFKGLDDGIYKLIETKTPTNYNSIADVIFTIEAGHGGTNGDTLTLDSLSQGNIESGEVDLLSLDTLESGSLSGDVVNKKGSELPSTGGIGTKLFYIGGGCMVGIAGIYLISKKRMKKEQE